MYGCIHCPSPLSSPGLLAEIARGFTPRVEARLPTPVLLDLRGLSRVWPEPSRLGQALHDAMLERGLTPHVALASTRVTALLVARVRPGLTLVAPGEEARTLAPLPLDILDAGEEHLTTLARWGLRTLGDLAALPTQGLAARFGSEGLRLARASRGEDEGPLTPTAEAEVFELSLDLEWPVDGLEPLSFLLARLLEPLMGTLVERARSAQAVTLSLHLADGTRHHQTVRASAPSVEPRTWRTLLLLDLEADPPRDAIVGLAVRAEPTPPRVVQFSLLDPAQPAPEQLADLLAGLRDWALTARLGTARLLDTHRPGAFALASFAPRPFEPRVSGASTPRMALRTYRPSLPADVVVREGAPAHLASYGIRGRIADRAGPWRASGDWWDVAWSREEWDVALDGGGLYRIYRDTLRGDWYVEAEID